MKCQNYVWIIVWKFKIILEIWGSSDNFQYWNEIKCSSCINRENLDVHLVWKFVYQAWNFLYHLFICSWNFKIGSRTRDFLWMNNGWTYVNLCSKNVYRLQKFVDQVSIKNKKFNISKNKMFIKRKKKYCGIYNVHILANAKNVHNFALFYSWYTKFLRRCSFLWFWCKNFTTFTTTWPKKFL